MSKKQKKNLIRIIAAAVFFAAGWIWSPEGIWGLIVFLLPYALVGYDVLWSAIRNILDESEVVQGLIRQAIRENASTPLKQDEYTMRFNVLYDRQTALHDRNAQIEHERIQRKIKRERMLAFIDRLRATDCLLTEFDECLWNATVESVTVQADGGLRFRFRNGREVEG